MRANILLSRVILMNVIFAFVENACENCDKCSVISWCSQCSQGYYTNFGSCSRCYKSCITCSSWNYCTSCKNGYHGSWCGNRCDTNCVNTTCHKTDGKCVFGCSPGYYQFYDRCERCSDQNWAYCSTVNGGWGPWSKFTPCSVTCGEGIQTRWRSCDKPVPQNGGQDCVGEKHHSKTCEQFNCPVNGGWGPWSKLTPCSVSCGEGIQTRSRSCDKPVPQNGGQDCVGEKINNIKCEQLNCRDDNGSGLLIGGAAGGVALFIIFAVLLALFCLFRRRKRRQRTHGGDQVFFTSDAPEAATAGSFEHSIMNRDASRNEGYFQEENMIEDDVYAQPNKPKKDKQNDSIKIQNEENTYSIPQKDSHCERKREHKERGPQDELNIPTLPRKLYQYMEDDDLEEINTSEMDTTDGKIPDQSETYYNIDGMVRRRVPVENLANIVAEKSAEEFLKEFETLTDGLTRDYTAAMKPENKYRNRYKLIYPYDVTRVKLIDESPDYINASYIDGYQQPHSFIACLGPTEIITDNFALFWTMVWQQKVEKIVMLTRLMEGKKMKCEQYWPESESKSYGDITVYRISEENYAEFSIRSLEIVKGSMTHRVCHMHYLAWPDRGVPDDVTSLLEFRHKVLAMPATLNGPTIVHCSAGIGRTGTYIALDMLIREGSCEHYVDVFGCVNGIRGQRTNLVQNVDQYKFLHYALVHELSLHSQMLSAEHMAWFVTDEGQQELRGQFEQLETVIMGTTAMVSESDEANRDLKIKKRKEADVHGGRHRVKLKSKKSGSADCINATYINGYIKRKQFIIAQTPQPETLEDFVELVLQEKIACIVSMDPEITQENSSGVYLPPANQTLNVGIFTITCTQSESFANHVVRELEISKRKGHDVDTRTVYHFQQAMWQSTEAVPNDALHFVHMVTEVEQTAAKDGKSGGRILVHCLNAEKRSGLFCVVALLIQKLRYDQDISVINTVRRIKSIRQLAIPNEDQFIFCYKCVVAFQTSTDDTYTNVNWRI